MDVSQLSRRTLLAFALSYSITGAADTFNLRLGDYNNFSPYMRELIKTSLELDGHIVNVEVLPKSYSIRRMIKEVSKSKLPLFWSGKGRVFPEKEKLLMVPVGLTQGLKAKQVLFINKGTQSDYDGVTNLDEFRALGKQGVFGTGWAAVNHWKRNELNYMTIDGVSTKAITKMSIKGNRGFDYFSRGVLASPKLIKKNPQLVLEKNLVIEFEDDFVLYLDKEQAALRLALNQALEKSKSSGHMDLLLRKFYPDTFNKGLLDYDNRIKLKLAN